MKRTRSRQSLLFLFATLAGCATVAPRARFEEVQRDVAARSDLQVHWNTGDAADLDVTQRVDALLARPLDVDAAAQIALLNNHHLQAEYESLGVAQADLVEAGLLRNPVFDGSVRFVEGGGTPTVDLGVAFNFLDLFFVGLRKRVAAEDFEVTRITLTERVLATVGDVKSAFYSLQAAQQQLELSQQIAQATAASAELAAKLRAAGNNRPLDLAQEQALHEQAVIELEDAELQTRLARERLAQLMGIRDAQNLRLAGRLADPPSESDGADDAAERTVQSSLALAAARQQITVALARLGIARPLEFGEVDVGASAERDDGAWEVGPALSVPIPLFDQGAPAVARAQSAVRAARERYRALQIDVVSAARTSADRVQSLRRQIHRYRNAILPLRESIVHDTQLQYNAMQIGAFQLLEAKREQIAAGRAYVGVLRDYWIARADLELAARGGYVAGMKGAGE